MRAAEVSLEHRALLKGANGKAPAELSAEDGGSGRQFAQLVLLLNDALHERVVQEKLVAAEEQISCGEALDGGGGLGLMSSPLELLLACMASFLEYEGGEQPPHELVVKLGLCFVLEDVSE